MNAAPIYLSIDDMMKLMGTYSRASAGRKHRQIRKELRTSDLTICDYCKFSSQDYKVVYAFLRGCSPPGL